MKTANEILGLGNSEAKLDKEATELANYLIDRLTKRKLESINNENVSVSEILMHNYGTYKYAETLVKRTASILCDHGFYVQTGWCETTPNGNERPIIKVRLTKPKSGYSWCVGKILLLLFIIPMFILTILWMVVDL